jgi:lysophospholipase-2
MARTFILWLHGLGDSGPANEPIQTQFKSSELSNASWLFPSAPFNPVTCNNGAVMRSWFDVPELPFKVVLLHFTLDLSNASYSMNWQIVNGLVAPS